MEHKIPEEIWLQIILDMNYDTIKNMCHVNGYFKHLCIKNRKSLVNKFSKDSFDISKFTQNELENYQKVKSLKQRMFLTKYNENILNITYDNHLFTLNNLGSFDVNEQSNVNKLIYYDDLSNGNKLIVLSNDGEVIMNEEVVNSNIIDISAYASKIYMITKDGKYHECNNISSHKISTPFNIIQKIEDIYLTDDGKIFIERFLPNNGNLKYAHGTRECLEENCHYMRNMSIQLYEMDNLPNIMKILNCNMIVSENGDIYTKSGTSFKLCIKYKNIIQMCESVFHVVFLDNMNNIYYEDNKKQIKLDIPTNVKITEILCYLGDTIYVLSDDMKLYVYQTDRFIKSYDLLDF